MSNQPEPARPDLSELLRTYDHEASAEYGKHLFRSAWHDSHGRSQAGHADLEAACQWGGVSPSDVLPLLPPLPPPEVIAANAARREAEAERQRAALAARMAEIEALVAAGRHVDGIEARLKPRPSLWQRLLSRFSS